MGQKVNPHGLRVGVIKDWDLAGMPVPIRWATWLWRTITSAST